VGAASDASVFCTAASSYSTLPGAGPATKVVNMSLFRVNIVACNPQREDRVTPPIDVLVDTGAELTWLPAELLEKIGIQPRRKRTFQTATKQLIERDVGYAILRAEGYETTDEVVFALPTDLSLLGVRTIEGFGVMVDNLGHRFVATTTLVANAGDIHPRGQ
jgi:predicted aspartyl protease